MAATVPDLDLTGQEAEVVLSLKGGETIFEQHGTRPGNAFICKLHHTLEHRVRPLTSGNSRRVFAAWSLRAEPT